MHLWRLARRKQRVYRAAPSHEPANSRDASPGDPVICRGNVAGCFAAFRALELLRSCARSRNRGASEGAGATFLRVNAALLIASAWTIPAGVAIGFHPRLAQDRAAAGTDCRILSGDGDFSYPAARAGSLGRRVGHWVDCADVAGYPVVHPVQCDCRCFRDSFDLKEVAEPFPLFSLAALEDCDSCPGFFLTW